MKDNSTISNFAYDKDMALMILKYLRQVIETVVDRYQHYKDFRLAYQEILKIDEDELTNIENLYNSKQEVKEPIFCDDKLVKEPIFCIDEIMKERIFFIDEIIKEVNESYDENGFPELFVGKLILLLDVDPVNNPI